MVAPRLNCACSEHPRHLTRLMFTRLMFLVLVATTPIAAAADSPDPARGLQLLLEKPYLPPAFDQETFDQAWKSWEEPLRSRAASTNEDERRRLAYGRYGLVERPGDPHHRPLQYVVDDAGNWTMNCLACHQGRVAGQLIPGAPNVQLALETLTQDIRSTKLRLGKQMTDVDVGSLIMPLGTTVGTTNAVMFGVALFHYRDADLNLVERSVPPPLVNHDHDAPPWWNTSLKERLYSDNFAPRGHRALMQFIASKENGPEKFRQWEDDFRHIDAYINSLQPPRYPFAIDKALAAAGQGSFEQHCAQCHGTYGPEANYPETIVPWEVVRTDPVRLRSLTVEHRAGYGRNWINQYGEAGEVIADPGGYLAPPLAGVWASAPYLHNGSVPTLWHLLHPDARPAIWTRHGVDAYDTHRVGLQVQELSELPPDLSLAARRYYFDTRLSGKSARGHLFPEVLTEPQRRAVLEYLKTL